MTGKLILSSNRNLELFVQTQTALKLTFKKMSAIANQFVIEEERPVETFAPTVSVTELWMKTLENTTKDFGVRVVNALAEKYNFSQEEAIKVLGLENMSLIRKQMAKKEKKEKPAKADKADVILPFSATSVKADLCCGLAYNRGLFTQCPKKPLASGSFCKTCQAQADKNTGAKPDCGTVQDRIATGLYEFVDTKGRKPTSFVKVMKKLNLTKEQVLAEASKIFMVISEEHFAEPEKKKTTGRPKKASASVKAADIDDMFSKLSIEDGSEMGQDKPKKIVSKLTEEEKAIKKAQLEAEKAERAEKRKAQLDAKKAEREAKLEQEKTERAEKRAAELAQKKAEREAKLAEEKAQREAKKAQDKAEREAKKAQDKSQKETEKKGKKSDKPAAEETTVKTTTTEATKVEEKKDEVVEKVRKITIDGKVYYYAPTSMKVYDPKTSEHIGQLNQEKTKIIPLANAEASSDEESDEEEIESDYLSE